MQISRLRILATLRTPAIISSLVVLPFMILEVTNRRGFGEGFPVALFIVMWLLPASFILVLTPLVRDLRSGGRTAPNPWRLVPRVAFLLLVAWLWAGLVLDQAPCFMGVPNCD